MDQFNGCEGNPFQYRGRMFSIEYKSKSKSPTFALNFQDNFTKLSTAHDIAIFRPVEDFSCEQSQVITCDLDEDQEGQQTRWAIAADMDSRGQVTSGSVFIHPDKRCLKTDTAMVAYDTYVAQYRFVYGN
ncbi:hypothetical protein CEXT_47351 [Caerostris extrusa]|uniref:Uncharacterized protein n=1 Tax=Caerostris extrusa TaxID=172846 RepID=A0AAV4MU16_CAEEX|nr:hypothetical protein CEXT_47351 [Caerostris extrusa]